MLTEAYLLGMTTLGSVVGLVFTRPISRQGDTAGPQRTMSRRGQTLPSTIHALVRLPLLLGEQTKQKGRRIERCNTVQPRNPSGLMD